MYDNCFIVLENTNYFSEFTNVHVNFVIQLSFPLQSLNPLCVSSCFFLSFFLIEGQEKWAYFIVKNEKFLQLASFVLCVLNTNEGMHIGFKFFSLQLL